MFDPLDRLRSALADRYTVERQLGIGGMATVYLARDIKHDRNVAIKVLHPDLAATLAVERFAREIEIVAKLAHPHILPLFDSGEADGLLYYVMPYVEGESLRQRLRRAGPFPVQQAIRTTEQIAAALTYAHERGVVHRDIKPENILLVGDQAIVADFGIARALEAAGGERLTETGLAIGTVAYMSPEQALGSQEVDARSDVYALGCVVYEMLAGHTPFEAAAPQAIVAKHAAATVPSLRVRAATVPASLERAVKRALAKHPADRFASASAFAEALVTGTPARSLRRGARGLAVAGFTLAAVAAVLMLELGGLRERIRGRADPGTDVIRLAVLPFENITGDPEQEYLSDGLTEEMIAQLGRLDASRLVVIARTSSMRYKGSGQSVPQIGSELGVDYVIESSVRREASHVRIDTRLIRVRDQAQVWTDSYDRELSGILALQSDVARSVARALKLTLLPAVRTRLTAVRPVEPQAYDAYLNGLFRAEQLTPTDLDLALQYFERALRYDSGFAPAYEGIALVWTLRSQMGYLSKSEAVANARPAAMRALELDSTLSVAHMALGLVAGAEWDWETTELEVRRAMALDPNFPDARVVYSSLLMTLGRSREALSEIEFALELDPLNPFFRTIYGAELYQVRRYDEAAVELRQVLRASPGFPLALCALWNVLNVKRVYEEALTAARGCLEHYGDEVGDALVQGYAEGGYGLAMRRVADLLAAGVAGVYVAPIDPFFAYFYAGQNDLALDWLSRAVDMRDPNLPWVASDPQANDSLGSDPRFQGILRRAKLQS